MDDWKESKKEFYGERIQVSSEGGGYIDFSPESMSEVKNGVFKSYDEYLDVQERSSWKWRTYFALCYNSTFGSTFTGRLEKIYKARSKALFQRIMVAGLYDDGTGFYGKEDHVWMDLGPFAEYAAGDCLEFTADVYRYMKHGKGGKLIDFGLSNPESIKKVDSYRVPTDEELTEQSIRQLVCETCIFHDHCYMGITLKR